MADQDLCSGRDKGTSDKGTYTIGISSPRACNGSRAPWRY